MEDLRAELTSMMDEAEWSWLIPHAQRDVLLVVADELDLVDVGVAIASDNTTAVKTWIDQQLLAKPSAVQLSQWNDNQTKRFNALIVQPFVLIQEMQAAIA